MYPISPHFIMITNYMLYATWVPRISIIYTVEIIISEIWFSPNWSLDSATHNFKWVKTEINFICEVSVIHVKNGHNEWRGCKHRHNIDSSSFIYAFSVNVQTSSGLPFSGLKLILQNRTGWYWDLDNYVHFRYQRTNSWKNKGN